MVIEIEGVTKLYKMGEEIVHALRGVSLKVEEGEIVTLIGANGAGSERFGGYVLRAGLEDAVLSADEIAERWHRLQGDWIG